MKITRYNRSFIGLMEMCNSGNWCKWEEVKEVLEERAERENLLLESYTTLYLEKYNPKINLLKTYLKIIFVLSVICNFVLAAKIDGVL